MKLIHLKPACFAFVDAGGSFLKSRHDRLIHD